MGQVVVKVTRVGPLADMKRSVYFSVTVSNDKGEEVISNKVSVVPIKDTGGKFVFEGPMAAADKVAKNEHVPSPMPGVVEKINFKSGDKVKEGDVLCIISAMKMEVKVSAPADGVIDLESTTVGYRVVEGALLFSLKH